MKKLGILFLSLAWLAGCGARPRTAPEVAAAAPAGPAVFHGLVEYGRNLLFFNRAQGEGSLTIDNDRIEWTNDDDADRSFSIQPKIVRRVWLNCAQRAGGDICLELGMETVTGETYRFRDEDWESGGNRNVLAVYEEIERRFPNIRTEERKVDEVS